MALRKKAPAAAAAEKPAAPAAQEAEKPAAKTRKAPAKRTPAAKKAAAPQVSLTLQYMGKELSQEDMVAAVKAQPVRTLAGSAVDAPVSTGLDCGRPAEYVPR